MTAPELERLIATFRGHRIDHDNARYYAGLLGRRLLVERCESCGRFRHPPKPMCPDCWCTEATTVAVCGTGSVHAHTVDRQLDPVRGGVAGPGGTVMVTVVLDEQPDLVVTSVYVGAEPPTIGRRVRVVWIEVDDHPFPGFAPEDDE